eukprot:6070370-Karenia_brevis.AAC.1
MKLSTKWLSMTMMIIIIIIIFPISVQNHTYGCKHAKAVRVWLGRGGYTKLILFLYKIIVGCGLGGEELGWVGVCHLDQVPPWDSWDLDIADAATELHSARSTDSENPQDAS